MWCAGYRPDPAAVPRVDPERAAGGQGGCGADAGRGHQPDVRGSHPAIRRAHHRAAHPHSGRPLQRQRQSRRA